MAILPPISENAPDTAVTSVTITAGGTTSSAISLDAKRVIGFIFPSNWVTSTVTFTASADGVNYYSLLYCAGEADTPTVVSFASLDVSSAAKFISVDPTKFLSVPWLKVVAGTTQSSTDKIIYIVTQRL